MNEEEQKAAAGRNFRRALARANVKASQVAQITGATASQVSNWGKRGVSAQYATRVASYLKVKPHQISIALDPESEIEPLPYVEPRIEDSVVAYKSSMALVRLIELLEEAELSVRDLALIEELVHRLAKGR